MKADMSYYQQVKRLALPMLDAYQDDLLVHDRKALRAFTGKFIYGVRNTGTNLLKFVSDESVSGITREAVLAFLFHQNLTFFIGEHGLVRKVSKAEALKNFEYGIETGAHMILHA